MVWGLDAGAGGTGGVGVAQASRGVEGGEDLYNIITQYSCLSHIYPDNGESC